MKMNQNQKLWAISNEENISDNENPEHEATDQSSDSSSDQKVKESKEEGIHCRLALIAKAKIGLSGLSHHLISHNIINYRSSSW